MSTLSMRYVTSEIRFFEKRWDPGGPIKQSNGDVERLKVRLVAKRHTNWRIWL